MSQPVDPQYAAIVVLVGLQFLVGIGTGISTIISNSKRKPSLDQEVYRDFVRRVEMDNMRAQFVEQVKSLDDRHQKSAGEIFNVLRNLKDDIGRQSTHIETSLNSVAKELGKIDGRLQGHIEAEESR